MLAQGLAIAVAMGSTLLFLTAFLFPKLHRQDDFFWSAVGLFYALILWVCAGQMAGAVLLGQLASVILLGWFAWETLRLRQAIIDPSNIPNLDKVSLVGYVKERFSRPVTPKTKSSKATTQGGVNASTTATPPDSVTPETMGSEVAELGEEAIAELPTQEPESEIKIEAPSDVETAPSELSTSATSDTQADDTPLETEAIASGTPEVTPEVSDIPSTTKKGFSFGRLFNRKDTTATPVDPPETPQTTDEFDEIFAEVEPEEANDDDIADPVTDAMEEPKEEQTSSEPSTDVTELISEPEMAIAPETSPSDEPLTEEPKESE